MGKSFFKKLILLCLLFTGMNIIGQEERKISTLDFVQVLNNNKAEALYYYQNNWLELRKKAVEKGYIASFDFLETEPTPENPINFILITTYLEKDDFEKREENFAELIKERGGLQLLNEIKPEEFRKTLFSHEKAFHLF